VANESGLRRLGDEMVGGKVVRNGYRRSGRPRWTGRRKVLTFISSVVAVVLLAVGGGYAYVHYRFDQIPKSHDPSLVAELPGEPFNMLVVGSDSRAGLTPLQQSQFGTSNQVVGQRSDVTMVWHVNPATKQITILSIPRDTLVSMVGAGVSSLGQFNRINASFDTGPDLLVKTIEDNFGIPINHVMQVDFAGFEGAVNALDGVYLNFNYPAKDTYTGLNITTTGCQLLQGQQALAVARSRHYEYYENGYWHYDGTSDFGRIQRQDAFLRALVDAAKSKYNPLTINAFLGSIPQGITIDDQLGLNELLGLAIDFHSLDPNTIATETLPTISDGSVSPWGDVLFVDQPATQQMLVSTFGSELKVPTVPPPNTSLESTPPPTVTPTTAAPTTTHTTAPAPPQTPSFDPTTCTPH
jgi:LCP family protein required for cell wall assembly